MITSGRESTCDPEILSATEDEFDLINRLKPANHVYGVLNELRVLTFVIENKPKDGTGCPGWWMFDQMMAHFGDRVGAVMGAWSDGDNIAAVNKLTAAGVSLEDAALRTPTGRYAVAHGYTAVTVFKVEGRGGDYGLVRLLFEPPPTGANDGNTGDAGRDRVA